MYINRGACKSQLKPTLESAREIRMIEQKRENSGSLQLTALLQSICISSVFKQGGSQKSIFIFHRTILL